MLRSRFHPFLGLCLTLALLENFPQSANAQENAALAASVQPFVDKQELAGAVMLVASKSKVLAVDAVGWADVNAKVPMKTDAMFWIASQSKPITAAALMILVDEGKVRLDDPVEKYLPEFRGQMYAAERDDSHVVLKKPANPPTVRNLLAHTSGMPFKSRIEQPTLDILPLSARVHSYAMTPLDFQPNTRYQYSNAGINTAARIIEVITQQSFEAFLHERIFVPLLMNATTFWPNSQQAEKLAKAYKAGTQGELSETRIEQLYYPLTDRTMRTPMPAGGLFSTAHDLARFYQMLLNGGQLDDKRILSDAAVKELISRQTPMGLKESYGLGFSVSDKSFGHGGAYSTNSTAETDRGLILIWLVQHGSFPGDGGKAQETFKQAARQTFGKQ